MKKTIAIVEKNKRLVFAAAVVLTTVGFVTLSPYVKEDDSPFSGETIQRNFVTRFPLRDVGVLLGEQPDSAIFLSWYDNTVRLSRDGAVTEKLGAVLYPVIIPDRTLTYAVSDQEAAEIDDEGNILAKKPGSVEISVRNEYTSKMAKAFLHIIQPVTGMYLRQNTINLFTTDMNKRLEAVVLPDNASNASIKWYSKNDEIAEVDQTGHLKPKGTGMTEVVASSVDGDFTSKCFVNVINEVIKVESVSILNKEGIKLNVGDTWLGMASVLPANAKNTFVEWESSDTRLATVTKTGLVKALSEGMVTITAKNSDGPYDTVAIQISAIPTMTDSNINNAYETGEGIRYTAYEMTLNEMVSKTAATNPTYNNGNGNVAADGERITMYVDPNEFCKGAYKYQFMDLSHYNGISREALNGFLEGKGILSGQADAFIEAAREYNMSELYLVAHACVETGYGRSRLANGVNVNGALVYNMYGIGAYDYNAVATGSQKAYSEGWTSPAKAIKEGARWISEHYINSPSGERQNTLYKMRWNPDAPGTHLYAGDVSWAVAQATIMEKLFGLFPDASLAYEIPVYAGSNAAQIE